MLNKTGWDTGMCVNCAYNARGKCTIAKSNIHSLKDCPEHYTYELYAEIRRDINRRMSGLPHGNVFSREW